jgi:hypothetical protein
VKHPLFLWLRPALPIFRREVSRGLIAPLLPERSTASLMTGFPILFIWIYFFAQIIRVNMIEAFLIVMLPLLFLVRVRVVLTAADAITGEVEQRTWDTLRTMPYSTETIVRSKFAGWLYRARRLFYQMLALRTFVGLGFAFVGPLIEQSYPNIWNRTEIFLPYVLAGAYFSAAVLLDYTTDGALGLAAGAFSGARGEALVRSTTLGVASVAVQLAVDAALGLALIRNHRADLAAILVIVALRYVFMRGLLALAARCAKAI